MGVGVYYHYPPGVLYRANVNSPLLSYDTLGAENIPYILNHTNLSTLFCSKDSMQVLLKCENLGKVKNVVSFDIIDQSLVDKFKEKGINVYIYPSLLEKYEKSDVKAEAVIKAPEDVVSFSYTSGTTGPPKGAMLTARNLASFLGALKSSGYIDFNEDDTHISYLPLAHVLESICLLAVLVCGGKVVSFSGNIKNIKSDM